MPRLGTWLIAVGAAVTGLGIIGTTSAGAVTNPTPFDGNVTTCAQVGLGSSLQYNGSTTTSVVNEGLFTVTVTNDRLVTISNIAAGVVFQAVVVKGGDGYHVYNPIVANMQAPLNGGGNVPALSHWFACYTYTPVVTTVPTTVVETTTPTTVVETTTPTTVVVTTTPTTTPTTVVQTTTPTTTPTTVVETTTLTTVVETSTTEVGSEGPTTTLQSTTTEAGATTTELASEGPTTTLLAGELPRTGSGDASSSLVLLGIFLLIAGGAITAMSRRALHS